MPFKNEKRRSAIAETASSFIELVAEPGVLITVTDVAVSDDLGTAKIFVSVLPNEKEMWAESMLGKKIDDLRHFLGKKIRMRKLPKISIQIDQREKNRQNIERLLAQG